MDLSSFMNKTTSRLFINYVWMAGLATVVDTLVLVFARTRLELYIWLSSALGYSCGMATNFLLNKYINFGSHGRSILRQVRTFFIVALIGLALTAGLMELFVRYFHLRLLIAKALAVGLVMCWSFWGHHTLTFQEGIRSFINSRLGKSA
ncbi:MAG: GtrA family protein [Candidatus Zixiibacteriota bacterium]|nr:MAG: GtrA family protein [candidate division Zixibacteria bacterium]